MNKEDKELLLKDLSARSPYGVKVSLINKHKFLNGVIDAVYPTDERVIVDYLSEAIAPINVRCGGFNIERNKVKPYLRPMSSMTKKEHDEYSVLYQRVYYKDSPTELDLKDIIDWLNAHHFDYRGLIEKGLALEAPEGMYN